MGERDHSVTCEVCGLQRGGLNDYLCDCAPCRRKEASPGPLKASLHQARISSWGPAELKAHMAGLVDAIFEVKTRDVSPLDVALELLSGELKAFVLFGHVGHLDPPSPDNKIHVGILEFVSGDADISATIRKTIQTWAAEQDNYS